MGNNIQNGLGYFLRDILRDILRDTLRDTKSFSHPQNACSNVIFHPKPLLKTLILLLDGGIRQIFQRCCTRKSGHGGAEKAVFCQNSWISCNSPKKDLWIFDIFKEKDLWIFDKSAIFAPKIYAS